ncbi:MAG TPA: hypothetical protein VF984_12455 [Actinomycetota bacterium]
MAVAWATLGILGATLVASFFYLGVKIDGLGTELRTAIATQGSELGGRIDALAARIDERIDALTSRIDGLNERLDSHIGNHRHAG